jgi:hypothetical protein
MFHPKYVKGFKFDRAKIALVAGVQSSHDLEVDAYIPIIKDRLNPHGYEYITLVWEHDVPRDAPDGRLALVVVLDTGDEAEELRQKKLGELDSSIEAARVALAGPDVWERYE